MSSRIDMRIPSHNQRVESEIRSLRNQDYDKGEIFEMMLRKYSNEKDIDDAVDEWSWFCVYRDQKRAPHPSCICSHGLHKNASIKPSTSIVIQFLLWNRFNHNVIRVGSECVKDFINAKLLTKLDVKFNPSPFIDVLRVDVVVCLNLLRFYPVKIVAMTKNPILILKLMKSTLIMNQIVTVI